MTGFEVVIAQYSVKAKAVYKRTDEICGGVFSLVWDSFKHFNQAHAPEAAASLAYYALFSIFPLLIFLVGTASSLLEDASLQKFVFDLMEESLPLFFQDLIRGNIEEALALRGRVQLIGMIGLLWAASAVFTVLTHNLNRAWHNAPGRNFILSRLVGLSMIAIITTWLVMLWLLSKTVLNFLPWLEIPLWNGHTVMIYNTFLWRLSARFVPWFVIFFTFWNLYRWVPNTKVKWNEAAWGAAVTALGWELIQRGFSSYLASFARYQLVYGSLAVVIGLMLWLYLSALVVLYGAHLSAAIARHTRLNGADEA